MALDPGPVTPDSFDELIDLVRTRLLPVLWSTWGVEIGSDICAEVEEYAWQHSERLLGMANPLGYLYRVSQSRARRYTRWLQRTTFPSRFPDLVHEDPEVHDVMRDLAVLNADQRACVLLVHGFGWSYAEVASLLGIKQSAVTNHVHRGLTRLRRAAPHIPADSQRNAPHSPENIT